MWKRVAGAGLLLVVSVWLLAMGLQTIVVTCDHGTCVHEVRYAGIATRATTFTASASTVSWRRTGKHDNLGVIDILASPAHHLSVKWLSPTEAEAAVGAMLHDPTYRLEATGPRWWLLFLLATVPVMLSLLLPPKLRIPAPGTAPPIARTKRAARLARGRAKRARDRAR
jgi:hypothetical protein